MKTKISNIYLNYFSIISLGVLLVGILYFVGPSLTGFVTYTSTILSNQIVSENLTFTGNQNISRNISLPIDASINNATMTLTAYAIINYCFQEFANQTTSCGGLAGDYLRSISKLYQTSSSCPNGGNTPINDAEAVIDGNYSTGSGAGFNQNFRLYINYTKPLQAKSVITSFAKNALGTTSYINATVPPQCFNTSSNMGGNLSMLYCISGDTYNPSIGIWCYNGSDYESIPYTNVGSNYQQSLMEESMYWDVQNYTWTNNTYLQVGTPDSVYEWNYSGMFNISQNTSNFYSSMNTYINSGSCDCVGCIKNDFNCTIPLIFHSDNLGIFAYSNINITWDDIRPPRFSINTTNATSLYPRFNDSFQTSISVIDGVNLSSCIYSTNATGYWSNDTTSFAEGLNVTFLNNKTINLTKNHIVGWTLYCNDTSNNRNQSEIFKLQVKNTAPRFNHTISAQSVVANNEFKFYFNASDVDLDSLKFTVNDTRFLSINSTNGTLNGTPTSSFIGTHTINVTVNDSESTSSLVFDLTVSDSLNPQWSGNATNANYSFPKYGDVIQLNVTLTDNSALKNFTLTVDQNGVINNTNRTISGTSYLMIENVTIISPQGTTNKWNVTIYDTTGNVNYTSTFTFLTRNSSPQWSNNVTNANLSFPKKGDTIQLNVTINSNVALKNYSITFNQAGNSTILNRTISGSSYNVIENFTISANQGTTNKWNVTFYDLGAGSNSTDTFTFFTRNTAPTVTAFNITNDTTVNFNNKTYYVTGNGTFADADSNNSLLTREIRWLNGTTIIPSENIFSLNCAQYSNTYCAVGQNITAQMRVSDNSGELSNLSDWNASTFIIIDSVYPTSFANLTAGNVSDNDGDGNIEINWTDDAIQINETYRLYRHTSIINSSSISSASLIGSNIQEGTKFFKDNSTTNGTTYWYALVTQNQDGFFNLSVPSLSFNATPNDTIRPKTTAGLNVTASSDTATLSWANVSQDVRNNPDNFGLQYVIYYGTTFNSSKELANESITSPSTKTVSGNSTTITVSSSGTYHFVVTTLDDGSNKNLTLILTQNYGNASLTVSSSGGSSGSSGGGGGGGGGSSGGGGGGTPDTTSSSHFYQDIVQGAETTLKVPLSKTIAFFKIVFTPVKSLSSVTLDIKEHTESTTPVSISANVYQYIEITLKGIKDADVSGSLIQFRVSKNWIRLGNYDENKVIINRYVSNWVPLPTTKTDEDSDYVYYNSQSLGFSVFAITAEKKETPKVNATTAEGQPKTEEEVKQEPTVEQPLAKEEKPKEICGNNACKGFEWVTCPKDCYKFKIEIFSQAKIHWLFVLIGTISLFVLFVIGDQALQFARKPKELRKPKTSEEEKKEAMIVT